MNDLLAEMVCQRTTTVVERCLAYAPETRLALAGLAGHSLGIECTAPPLPPLSLLITFTREGVRLTPGSAASADTVVRGSPPALVALAVLGQGMRSPIAARISGDPQLIEDLRAHLVALDLDWEAALATLVGDVPAHGLGKLARGIRRWQLDTRQRSAALVSAFIADEAGSAPGLLALAGVGAHLRQRRANLDRLTARVATLQTQLADALRIPR